MIKPFASGMEESISRLIRDVFDTHVGYQYAPEGKQTMYDFIRPDRLREQFLEKGSRLLIDYEGERPVGVIGLRDYTHISLFFVETNSQGKGIGKRLFRALLQAVEDKDAYLTCKDVAINTNKYKSILSR